ncbi:MAG: HU family DNA-binding protein [Tannerella sp.]|jgi:nucleoid DNA-binding protein/cytoskeletal protein RodZ|nr:HU family DNA-binding protein [Tannerella sp.]
MKMIERISTHSLAELLSERTDMDTRQAEKFINTLAAYITHGIEKNKSVKILGFGTFKIVLVRERESVHIQTGERFTISAHHKLSFIPDKDFKDHINRPFSIFEPIETTSEKTPDRVSFSHELVVERQVVSVGRQNGYDDNEPTMRSYFDDYGKDDYGKDDSDIYNIETGGNATIIEETLYEADVEEISYEEPNVEEPESVKPVQDDDYDYFADNTYNTYIAPGAEETVTSDYDMENISGNISEEEVLEEVFEENPIDNDKKKHVSFLSLPLWIWVVLGSLLVILGVGIGTYAFLSSNRLKSGQDLAAVESEYETEPQPYIESEISSPSPIGLTQSQDAQTRENDNPDEDTEQATAPEEDVNNNASDSETSDTTQEKPPVRDWLSSHPETQQTADNKNKAAANNKNTAADTKKTDTKPTTSGNADNKATTATESAKRIRMTAGTSLTQIALEHYGDKVFWVYIYDYNKSRIKDFNNIAVGTELRLPPAKTYGINAKDKSSVNKARQKQAELLKWDKWDDYN